jgi:SAM-dependent methyltransferase
VTAEHPSHGHDHHGRDHCGDGPDVVRDQAFWDERYRSSSALWSGRPGPHLVTEASGLVPGNALEAGCGEGADTIWLAGQGWQVTAVDISTVALARGAARAAQAGADIARRITWQHADLAGWIPGTARYDLVSAQFMHLPPEPRGSLFRLLAALVAPGGSLLVVGHHPSDLQTTAMRPPVPELFFTAAEVAASLDPQEWEIVVSAARERTATDPDGRAVSVHDTVLRAERRNS